MSHVYGLPCFTKNQICFFSSCLRFRSVPDISCLRICSARWVARSVQSDSCRMEPTTSSHSSKPRKILPVDVLESDGIFTRCYVQDVHEDGCLLVFFDRRDDPFQTIESEAVFETRSVGRDEWSLFADEKVEVLARLTQFSSQRWHPGTFQAPSAV